jgi:hypothetical protein
MNANELSIRALEHELQNEGFATSHCGSALSLGSLGLEVLAHETESKPTIYGIGTSVVLEARLTEAGSGAICILAVGYGETEDAAARDAARQWIMGVFPAIRSYQQPLEHICEVKKGKIEVDVPATGERYKWSVHVPPVICRRYGDCDGQLKVDNREIFVAIIDAVSQCASHDSLFWLECFAMRNPDGSIDATCRYNNNVWKTGQEALMSWASTWPDTGGCILSKRQFLIFEPVPVDELSSPVSSPVMVN